MNRIKVSQKVMNQNPRYLVWRDEIFKVWGGKPPLEEKEMWGGFIMGVTPEVMVSESLAVVFGRGVTPLK